MSDAHGLEDYSQAKLTFNAAIGLAVIGILIIFVGVALLLVRDAVAPGALTSGIGAVTEVISAILFRLNHETNNRLDEVGKDLSPTEAAQIAMTLIDKIEDLRNETMRSERQLAVFGHVGPNSALHRTLLIVAPLSFIR